MLVDHGTEVQTRMGERMREAERRLAAHARAATTDNVDGGSVARGRARQAGGQGRP